MPGQPVSVGTGANDPPRRGSPWTRARVARLAALVEAGILYPEIAHRLGTTATAVAIARKRHHIPAPTRSLPTAIGVARRLGISDCRTVTRWIGHGWLRARRGPKLGNSQVWYVVDEDLFAFLEDPAHWHRWTPERIPDAALREWAAEIRAGARFLRLAEVAGLCFVERSTVTSWIRKGWLAAVRNGHNHLVREADALRFREARLAGRTRP